MIDKLNKYLRHPIWSSVIAALIVLGLTSGYNYIISISNETKFKTEFINFWNYEFKLWFIILILIIIYLSILLSKKFIKRKKTFEYDNETLQLDRNLFEKIRSKIINDKTVRRLKGNAFSTQPFDVSEIGFIQEFLEHSDNPSFEFLNPELEILKTDLLKSINSLQESFGSNIFGTNINHPDKIFVGIPKEWSVDKYRNAQKEIAKNENLTFNNFEELVKTGRRVLKI